MEIKSRALKIAGTMVACILLTGGALAGGHSADSRGFIRLRFQRDSTFVFAINDSDYVAGQACRDQSCEGFVRAPDGTTTIFQASDSTVYTGVSDMNNEGDVVGTYLTQYGYRGYSRSLDGTISMIQIRHGSTLPKGITDRDVVAGLFIDSKRFPHGFVQNVGGNTKLFDPAGSVNTEVTGISNTETETGSYFDTGNQPHGFLRQRDGVITEFDVSGASKTYSMGINSSGATTGIYFDSNDNSHFFVRDATGDITTFDPPASVQASAARINNRGLIAGTFLDSSGISHGFVRRPDGTIRMIDFPFRHDQNGRSTFVWSLNNRDDLVGYLPNASPKKVDGFARVHQD